MPPKSMTTGLLLGFAGYIVLVAVSSIPTRAWAQQRVPTLYEFTGGADGGQPIAGVVMDVAGTLYGETYSGGILACTSKAGLPSSGCGTLYSWNAAAGLKVLASFIGSNGAYGYSTPTLVGSTLYGTTLNGGASDDGVVFSVRTDGTGYTLLHQFNGADGQTPIGILRMGAGGVLYGMTEFGGSTNYGVLFSITPQGIYSVLHTFTGSSTDGRYPSTLLISPTGTLVGSTGAGGKKSFQYCSIGCGTIFEYVPLTHKYSTAYLFDGIYALGGFIGSLGPGPTVYGNGIYSPYSVSLATGLIDYADFDQTQKGQVGSGPLVTANGSLVGVQGVGPIESGTLYSATKSTTTTIGFLSDSVAQPILLPGGVIVGTESEGGLCGLCGAIWRYTPSPS